MNALDLSGGVEGALANSEDGKKLIYPVVLFVVACYIMCCVFSRRRATFSGLFGQIFLGKALFFVGRGDAIPSGRRLMPD